VVPNNLNLSLSVDTGWHYGDLFLPAQVAEEAPCAAAADTGRAGCAVQELAAPDLWLCVRAGGARRGENMEFEA
jgi:hypothetical protein